MAIIKIKNPAIDLDAAEIPNIDASKITSGTFADARIADLSATKLTGSISDARLPANALNSNVDLTNLSASNLTSGTIPTARITALPAGVGGKILQVAQTTYGDTSTTSSSYSEFTTASITKSSASNKVLVGLYGNWSTDAAYDSGWSGGNIAVYVGGVKRFSTGYKGGESIGNIITNQIACNWLDSTNESSATYSFQIRLIGGDTSSVGISRIHDDAMNYNANRIILMEIAG